MSCCYSIFSGAGGGGGGGGAGRYLRELLLIVPIIRQRRSSLAGSNAQLSPRRGRRSKFSSCYSRAPVKCVFNRSSSALVLLNSTTSTVLSVRMVIAFVMLLSHYKQVNTRNFCYTTLLLNSTTSTVLSVRMVIAFVMLLSHYKQVNTRNFCYTTLLLVHSSRLLSA